MSQVAVSIVLPCLNEQDSIEFVLARLEVLRGLWLARKRPIDFEVIVVDDGSIDESASRIRTLSPWIQILRHESPRGYGAALKAGFALARGKSIVFFDMDSTYDPTDVDRCLSKLLLTGADIVYGRRPFWRSGMPLIRSIGNLGFTLIVRVFFGSGVNDIATGCRVFRRERLHEVLSIPHGHFDFGFSFTIWTLKHRWRIEEAQISYLSRAGLSKLNPLKDGLLFFRVVAQMLGAVP